MNQIYAPVADVNIDPDNPVINVRSFGEDPADVARYVAAFVRGVQSAGVLATAKHFPGHGDTHTDSHRSLPVLLATRERLESVELVPFRAAIEAGVGAVMTAHLSVPALDATPAPAAGEAASRQPLHEGRRGGRRETRPSRRRSRRRSPTASCGGELGFHGLVVTDALDMGGIVGPLRRGRGRRPGDPRRRGPGPEVRERRGRDRGRPRARSQSGRIPLARLDDAVARDPRREERAFGARPAGRGRDLPRRGEPGAPRGLARRSPAARSRSSARSREPCRSRADEPRRPRRRHRPAAGSRRDLADEMREAPRRAARRPSCSTRSRPPADVEATLAGAAAADEVRRLDLRAVPERPGLDRDSRPPDAARSRGSSRRTARPWSWSCSEARTCCATSRPRATDARRRGAASRTSRSRVVARPLRRGRDRGAASGDDPRRSPRAARGSRTRRTFAGRTGR